MKPVLPCPAPAQDDVEPAFQAAKKARVEAQEARWVQEMDAMREQQDKMKKGGAQEAGGWRVAVFKWPQHRVGGMQLCSGVQHGVVSAHAVFLTCACPCCYAGGGVGGMFKAVIDTVIGNLQLSISNVHIRCVFNTAVAALMPESASASAV